MDNRDISILTQVAFKGAIEAAGSGVGSDQGNLAFLETFQFLTDALLTEVKARANATPPAAKPAYPQTTQADPIGVAKDIFPGAHEAEVAHNVEVIRTKDGGQHGPLPSWFIKAAAEKGITKVFDNRDRLSSNPKLPWFKSTKEQGEVAFWPPRERASA